MRVSAAVLSAEDTRRMLGADLDKTIIQPVWIEVQNGTLATAVAAAFGHRSGLLSRRSKSRGRCTRRSPATRTRSINDHLDRLALKNPIEPGATHAGILFTNPQRRTKLLNVDLLGKKDADSLLAVPACAG